MGLSFYSGCLVFGLSLLWSLLWHLQGYVFLSDDGVLRTMLAERWQAEPFFFLSYLPVWMPLDFAVKGSLIKIFGDLRWPIVMGNACLSAGSLVFLCDGAKRLGGSRVAWAVTLLALTLPMRTWISLSALSEPLYYLCCCAMFSQLMRWWQQPTKNLIWLWLAATMAMMLRLESWVLALLLGAMVLWRRQEWRGSTLLFAGALWIWPLTWVIICWAELGRPLSFLTLTQGIASLQFQLPWWQGFLIPWFMMALISVLLMLSLCWFGLGFLKSLFKRSWFQSPDLITMWSLFVFLFLLVVCVAASTGAMATALPQRNFVIFILLALPLLAQHWLKSTWGWLWFVLVLLWHSWSLSHPYQIWRDHGHALRPLMKMMRSEDFSGRLMIENQGGALRFMPRHLGLYSNDVTRVVSDLKTTPKALQMNPFVKTVADTDPPLLNCWDGYDEERESFLHQDAKSLADFLEGNQVTWLLRYHDAAAHSAPRAWQFCGWYGHHALWAPPQQKKIPQVSWGPERVLSENLSLRLWGQVFSEAVVLRWQGPPPPSALAVFQPLNSQGVIRQSDRPPWTAALRWQLVASSPGQARVWESLVDCSACPDGAWDLEIESDDGHQWHGGTIEVLHSKRNQLKRLIKDPQGHFWELGRLILSWQ